MKLRALLSTFLIASLAPLAYAQEEAADSLLLPGYSELDELVIEAELPVIQSDGAKTTYNVEEDPSSASSSALEILKKVPQVSVDGDGKIRLNGQQNFKFQVNGQENPMLQQYADKILQGMPASAIARIEVITEPGAKQDAEGNAGIINIITEITRSNDGYSGMASLRVTPRDMGPSLNATVKKGHVTLSAGANYMWGFGNQKGQQESDITYLTGTPGSLKSLASQKSKFHFAGGNLNLSWEPNEKNLFTFGTNVFNVSSSLGTIAGDTRRYDPAGTLLWQYLQDGDGHFQMLNVSANASYRHNFSQANNYLIISYLFNFGKMYFDLNQWATESYGYTMPFPYQNRQANNINRGHTVQIDYANDFNSEHHLLEAGAKGIFRRNSAVSALLEGADAENLRPSEASASDIDQPQDIYSGYASYTGKFNALTVLAGLRYEHTRMGITNFLHPTQSFLSHLNDWVPNAALTWSFSPMSNLRAAYQMRISRPSIEQVNPFELALTPFEVRKGNPDLTSERTHKVSLSYSSFGRVFGGNIGLEYTLVNNAISGYNYLMQRDETDVLVSSYANIGRTQSYAVTGFCNWNIISHMSLSLNGRLAYNRLSAPSEGYRNHGWSGNIGGAWNYTVADVNKFSAYGGWFSRSYQVQGYSSGYYYYGISASRDLLKDKSLTVGVSANNFLAKEISYRSFSQTHDSRVSNVGKNLTAWNVALSVSWRFGSLKAQVKNTGADLNNDDINTSSNKGNGSNF